MNERCEVELVSIGSRCVLALNHRDKHIFGNGFLKATRPAVWRSLQENPEPLEQIEGTFLAKLRDRGDLLFTDVTQTRKEF